MQIEDYNAYEYPLRVMGTFSNLRLNCIKHEYDFLKRGG